VVSTVALNSKARGGIGDPERTIDICSQVIGDRHPMVTKALSWALRELTKRDIDRVESFLSTHMDKLAPLVIREVRKKIDTGRK
jgi:3-methyladenine DNA glycosylase AlkD